MVFTGTLGSSGKLGGSQEVDSVDDNASMASVEEEVEEELESGGLLDGDDSVIDTFDGTVGAGR